MIIFLIGVIGYAIIFALFKILFSDKYHRPVQFRIIWYILALISSCLAFIFPTFIIGLLIVSLIFILFTILSIIEALRLYYIELFDYQKDRPHINLVTDIFIKTDDGNIYFNDPKRFQNIKNLKIFKFFKKTW